MPSSEPKSLLIISYYYPPFWSTGTVRIAKMAKYLSKKGWRLTVITPRRLYMDPSDRTTEDYDAYADVRRINLALPDLYVAFLRWAARSFKRNRPTKTTGLPSPSPAYHSFETVYRPGLRKRFERFLMPIDFYILWLPWACLYSTFYVLRHRELRNVWISSPPFSQLLVGAWLKTLFPRLTFAADFQDHWIEDMNRLYPTGTHRRFETWAENIVYRKADRLIFVSEIHLDRCLEKGPWKNKAVLIYNGFDPDDFTPPDPLPTFPMLTLDYFGNIGEGRNIGMFIDTVADLVKKREIDPATFVCRFYGVMPSYFRDLIASHGIGGVIQVLPPIPYKDALLAMYRSFALLLSIDQDPYTSCYPSKYFEYLYVRRPVFILGPSRGAGRHAMENGIALSANEYDGPAIRTALLQLYKRFLTGDYKIPVIPIDSFNRERQAQQLADLFAKEGPSDARAV